MRFFLSTLALSATLHLLIFIWLNTQREIQISSALGQVAVEFIQPVTHAAKMIRAPRDKTPIQNNAKPMQEASPPNSETQVSSQTVEGTTDAKELNPYLQTITSLIEAKKEYPKSALLREEEGKVVVAITIDRNGQLTELIIEEPSPFKNLNQAALETVRKVSFPAVPATLSAPLHLHVPLAFKIQKN